MSLPFTLASSISFSPKSPKTLVPSKTLKSPRFQPKYSLHDHHHHHHHGRRPSYVPSRVDDPSYVRIFDTTLRDGEQSPGATMTSGEKLAVARHLARLGVDIIEARYPASSPDDLEAVRSIAREVGNQEDEDGYCWKF